MYVKSVNFFIFNFQTEAVGNRRTENLTKQMVHQQIPDARIQRKLTAVNIEDVPLAARLKLERGKGATKLIKTISDIKTEDKPTEKIKYRCRKCGVCTIMLNLYNNYIV